MAVNTSPTFPLTPKTSWVNLTTATVSNSDLTTGYQSVYTAGSDGGIVQKLIIQPLGTSTTPATFPAGVFKVFINNGSAVGTQSNNTLLREMLFPVLTNGLDADSTTLLVPFTECILNIQLQATYKLYVGYTGALSSAISINVTAISTDY